MRSVSACPTNPLTFDPDSADQLADPYPTYARMRDDCPVFHDRQRNIWVVTRHEDVLRVVHDPETFSSENAVRLTAGPEHAEVAQILAGGWSLTPNLTESDGAEHRHLRTAVGKVFTPKRISDLEPFVMATAEDLIGRFAAAGTTDIISGYAWPLPLAVMARILGIPADDVPRLHEWSYDWLRLSVAAGSVDERVRYARSVVDMQHYVMALLRDGGRAAPGGLVSSLASLSDESGLDDVEHMRIVLNLIIAGHVTVTRAIGNGLVALLENPRQLETLRDGAQPAETMVEEILRFESPVQGLFRTVTREIELGGRRLRAGDRVMVHWGSANRDERVITAPDRFAIGPRPGRHMLAFGRGVHACLGAPLARLQMRIAIPLLFDRLPGLRLGPGVRERLVIARGFEELHLRWDVLRPSEAAP